MRDFINLCSETVYPSNLSLMNTPKRGEKSRVWHFHAQVEQEILALSARQQLRFGEARLRNHNKQII